MKSSKHIDIIENKKSFAFKFFSWFLYHGWFFSSFSFFEILLFVIIWLIRVNQLKDESWRLNKKAQETRITQTFHDFGFYVSFIICSITTVISIFIIKFIPTGLQNEINDLDDQFQDYINPSNSINCRDSVWFYYVFFVLLQCDFLCKNKLFLVFSKTYLHSFKKQRKQYPFHSELESIELVEIYLEPVVESLEPVS